MSWSSIEPAIDAFNVAQDGSTTPSLPGTMWGKSWSRVLTNGTPPPIITPTNTNTNTETWIHIPEPGMSLTENTLKIAKQGGAIEWFADDDAEAIDMSFNTKIVFNINGTFVPSTVTTMTLTDINDDSYSVSGAFDNTMAQWYWTLGDFTGVDLTAIKSICLETPLGSTQGVFYANGGGEPHIVCVDGSRMEIYDDATYRLWEDSSADVVVNLTVRNAWASELSVIRPSTGERAGVTFSEDHKSCVPMQLQQQSSTHMTITEDEECSGGTVRIGIHGTSYTIVAQGKYASFAIHSDDWFPGRRLRRVGGALATIIHTLDGGLWDATPGPCKREIVVHHYAAHALVCDAEDPHIVTFMGTSERLVGDVQLLGGRGLPTIYATLDDKHRIERIEVPGHSFVATWERDDTKTRLVIDKKVYDNPMKYLDYHFGNLLVRLQPNGAASFAHRGRLPTTATGVLAATGDVAAMTPSFADVVTDCVYERCTEPHLAAPLSVLHACCIGCV